MESTSTSSLPIETPLPLWPPLLAARAQGSLSSGHSHHAMHLVLGLDGPLRMQTEGGPWESMAGVLTAPDVPHLLDAEGRQVLIVFLEPESEVGTALAALVPGPFRAISDEERDLRHPLK